MPADTTGYGAGVVRVLVADDDAAALGVLVAALGDEHDLEVVGTAADGVDALERCAQGDVDVVVLDLLMPRMNGFQLIEELRRAHPGVRLLACSEVAGPAVQEELARNGVALVRKATAPGVLADAVRRAHARPPDPR